MRLVADPEALRWLVALQGRHGDLEWDAGNLDKNRKHGVGTHDVEAMMRGDFFLAGRIIEPEPDEPRWLLLGVDGAGRRLALVVTRRGHRVRPISCRPMRRKERALYDEVTQTEDDDTQTQ